MNDRPDADSAQARFAEALRELGSRPASTPAAFAASRVAARLGGSPAARLDFRPWLAAAAFAVLGFALHRSNPPSILPSPVPAPVEPGVIVFALDSETTLYFALPGEPGGASEDPS